MGNCSHRAVSDGGSIPKTGGSIKEEYYRTPRRVGPTIQVSPQRRNGVWKAKVVIGSKQLEEILAVEGNTYALIDQLRFAAAAASASEMVRVSSNKNDNYYFC